MPLVAFRELMDDAARGGYAVGYFESWNLESLLAVADAAEQLRSPVILGFSGLYLPHPGRVVRDALAPYHAMARATAAAMTVPACLLFNESPHQDWVEAALDIGFDLVMFSDEQLDMPARIGRIRALAERAHARGAAVEAEPQALAGVGGDAPDAADPRLTDPAVARAFLLATGADALAVNVGQIHAHGRRSVRLDLALLREHAALGVPLVLHGASSVAPDDLRAAVAIGVRKINVGSRLKQAFLGALRAACAGLPPTANPYEAIGSGLAGDVLVAGRLAMQREVERFMDIFGSAGRSRPAGAAARR
jgi:fructose/tagatose bisphosphate aldolase